MGLFNLFNANLPIPSQRYFLDNDDYRLNDAFINDAHSTDVPKLRIQLAPKM